MVSEESTTVITVNLTIKGSFVTVQGLLSTIVDPPWFPLPSPDHPKNVYGRFRGIVVVLS